MSTPVNIEFCLFYNQIDVMENFCRIEILWAGVRVTNNVWGKVTRSSPILKGGLGFYSAANVYRLLQRGAKS